jgi:hypothetical protein
MIRSQLARANANFSLGGIGGGILVDLQTGPRTLPNLAPRQQVDVPLQRQMGRLCSDRLRSIHLRNYNLLAHLGHSSSFRNLSTEKCAFNSR